MPKSKLNKHKKSKKKQSNYRRPPKEKLQKKHIVAGLCLATVSAISILFETVWLKKCFEFSFGDFIIVYTPFKTWIAFFWPSLVILIGTAFYTERSKNKKVYIIILILFILLITVIHFAIADIWVFENEKIQRYNYAGTCKATYDYSEIVNVNYCWQTYLTGGKNSTSSSEVYEIVFDDETKVAVYKVECIKKDDDSFEVFRNRMEMYISE